MLLAWDNSHLRQAYFIICSRQRKSMNHAMTLSCSEISLIQYIRVQPKTNVFFVIHLLVKTKCY